MARRKLRGVLQQWFQAEVEAAPRDDPRRTPECLRFEELGEWSPWGPALAAGRAEHVRGCAWCRRAVELFTGLGPEARQRYRISTGAHARWPEELSARLSAWLREAADAEHRASVPSPAHFDAAGTLRVHWTGLALEGPVEVSLVWHEVEVPLTRGAVREGVLEVVEPMAPMGLRDVELPRSALRVRALGPASRQGEEVSQKSSKECEDA